MEYKSTLLLSFYIFILHNVNAETVSAWQPFIEPTKQNNRINIQNDQNIHSTTIRFEEEDNGNDRLYPIQRRKGLGGRSTAGGTNYPEVFIIRSKSANNFYNPQRDNLENNFNDIVPLPVIPLSDINQPNGNNIPLLPFRAMRNPKSRSFPTLITGKEPPYSFETMAETGLLGIHPRSPSIGIVPAQEVIPVNTKTFVAYPRGEEWDPEGLADTPYGAQHSMPRYRYEYPEKLMEKNLKKM